jgi:RNA polymerase sigma-70 factor (ECF subfamily)
VPIEKRPVVDSEEHERARRALYEYEAMVRRVQPSLAAYARRRIFDVTLVDDVVAETLATAWRKWSDVPRGELELAYLYAIERRVVSNQRRTLRRQQDLVTQIVIYNSDAGETGSGTYQELQVGEALRRLRITDQSILNLYYWEGLSARTIGVFLGCSENAATIRLHRARKRMEIALRATADSTKTRVN